jgi:translation initiation factor IF-3
VVGDDGLSRNGGKSRSCLFESGRCLRRWIVAFGRHRRYRTGVTCGDGGDHNRAKWGHAPTRPPQVRPGRDGFGGGPWSSVSSGFVRQREQREARALAQERNVIAPPKSDQHRINDRIRSREVRLIGPEGDQLGIKPVPEALRMARSLDLDLVEVAPGANPPVCRIMDYGKFRYEEAQKAKESRRRSTQVTVKEVKFRPKIGKGDFDTKVRHLTSFLEDGHKVKVTLQFRGREMAHPELGAKILDQVLESVGPLAKVDNQARMEGRSMSMVLSPDRKAHEAARKARQDSEDSGAEPLAETSNDTPGGDNAQDEDQ